MKETHKIKHIGWLRAAVLGANDGIVSTASLVLGVAAAGAEHRTILLTGVSGLVAGAMSMAAGEYVSVISHSYTENADLALERLHSLRLSVEHAPDGRIRVLFARALHRARPGGDPRGGIQDLQRILALEPTHVPALTQLMELARGAGARVGAERQRSSRPALRGHQARQIGWRGDLRPVLDRDQCHRQDDRGPVVACGWHPEPALLAGGHLLDASDQGLRRKIFDHERRARDRWLEAILPGPI